MVSLKYLADKVAIPSSGIKTQVSNTKAFIADQDIGTGELCVAESNLIWKKEGEEGLCIEYPNIALHAVSRDLAAFPHECIYVMLDKNILNENNSDSENEENESENITVIRFVPEDKTHLNIIFEAMNQCQALYPDESMSGDEEEDEEDRHDRIGYEFADDNVGEINEMDPVYYNEFTNQDDVELSSKGQEILRRLNINFQNQDQVAVETAEINSDLNNQEQYEDAEGNPQ